MRGIPKSTGKMVVINLLDCKISNILDLILGFNILRFTSVLCIFFSYKVCPSKGKFLLKQINSNILFCLSLSFQNMLKTHIYYDWQISWFKFNLKLFDLDLISPILLLTGKPKCWTLFNQQLGH